MNLAIEYLIRDKRSHSLLSLPCSLFVTSGNRKLVITIHTYYGESDYVMVKHWRIWQATKDDKLPPFSEYKVKKDEIFTSTYVIVRDCAIMAYAEEPYPAGNKQYADYPHCVTQDIEYQDYINKYCNTDEHKIRRLEWLWEAFESIYVTDDLRVMYGDEREVVQMYAKTVWYTWQYWKRHLLDFHGYAATELIFRRLYVPTEYCFI